MSRDYLLEAREQFLAGMGVPEKTEFKPDPFQKEAVQSVVDGVDTLVVAPTGSGKTYIAIESTAACLHFKQRVCYTTPLKALSNSKYIDLKKKFEPEFRVGILTGDRKIDTDADCVIATTEIYRNELYSAQFNYSLVVLDEVHYIGDPQRGPVWEESILLTPKDATILMLSASISNPQEIISWIEDVRQKPCRLIVSTERPVELRHGFLHPRLGIMPLNEERGRLYPDVYKYYMQMERQTAPRIKNNRGRR